MLETHILICIYVCMYNIRMYIQYVVRIMYVRTYVGMYVCVCAGDTHTHLLLLQSYYSQIKSRCKV